MWFCAQSHYWPTPFFDNCFRFLTLIVLIPVHANFPFSIPYFCLILNFIHKRFSLRSHFSLLDRYVVKINILSTIHVVDSNGYFISWLTQCPVKTCEVGQKELKDVMYPFLFLIKKKLVTEKQTVVCFGDPLTNWRLWLTERLYQWFSNF